MGKRGEGKKEGPAHRFGGDWTATKLEILKGYLGAYTTALKGQPFKTAYIDAFAGTGYRSLKQTDTAPNLLFPDLAEEAPQELLEGSARLALKIEPRFDRYIFVEKSRERCDQLEGLRKEFPHLASAIRIENGEANQVIQSLCSKDWQRKPGRRSDPTAGCLLTGSAFWPPDSVGRRRPTRPAARAGFPPSSMAVRMPRKTSRWMPTRSACMSAPAGSSRPSSCST